MIESPCAELGFSSNARRAQASASRRVVSSSPPSTVGDQAYTVPSIPYSASLRSHHREPVLRQRPGRRHPLGGIAVVLLPGALVVLERAEIGDRPLRDLAVFRRRQRDPERLHDLARQPLLQIEHVVHRAGVLLGPEVGIGLEVDQLRP